MAKSVLKAKARSLRVQGESIKQIARKLKVSPGSVSSWCKDIILSTGQIKSLENRYKDPYYGKRLMYLSEIKRKKDLKINRLRIRGMGEIGKLSKRELFLVGSALYWAEGFKKDKQAGFANQDPAMIKIFIKWLKYCFGYKDSDLTLRVTLNISHKSRVKEIQKYWSQITGIPVESFKKPTYQKYIWKKVYEEPNNYFGVLRIKVKKSLDFLRTVHGYIEGLKQS